MKRPFFVSLIVCIVVIALLSGCEERSESPTKGNVVVYADESLANVVSAAVDSFARLYPDTKLTLNIVPSREGIAKVLNNEAKIFVSARQLNAEEQAARKSNTPDLKVIKYCFDGIACVHSPDVRMPYVSFDSLKLLLSGKLPYKVVVPGANSGVHEYLRDSVLNGGELKNIERAESEQEVLKKTLNGKGTFGFLAWDNVGDSVNSRTCFIGTKERRGTKNVYFEPHPGYFVQLLYPLSRLCVIYLNEIKLGPASGFATYLSGNEGQKIVLARKLAPAAVPVKLVY